MQFHEPDKHFPVMARTFKIHLTLVCNPARSHQVTAVDPPHQAVTIAYLPVPDSGH
ncbi:hypothetical protein [Novosphingobium sp.]|uniref:hypothetical protein n=1 Tax=Novosphingobium sp. TaxID=1874826 RepID=UPI003D12D0D2